MLVPGRGEESLEEAHVGRLIVHDQDARPGDWLGEARHVAAVYSDAWGGTSDNRARAAWFCRTLRVSRQALDVEDADDYRSWMT